MSIKSMIKGIVEKKEVVVFYEEEILNQLTEAEKLTYLDEKQDILQDLDLKYMFDSQNANDIIYNEESVIIASESVFNPTYEDLQELT